MILTKERIEKIKHIGSKSLNGNDLDFFNRIWSTDFNIYKDRIKGIKFYSLDRVLDAGCGFGQWSIPLSLFNKDVFSIDISDARIQVLKEISNELSINNIHFYCGTFQKMIFEKNYFDAIYCYSAIYFTDFNKTIDEFYRVLKPGGKLYINSNGIGWYFYNLMQGHNTTSNFNSKKMAMNSFENSIKFYSKNFLSSGCQLIIPSDLMTQKLKLTGFTKIIKGSDGKIILDKKYSPMSFYPEKYYEHEGVYEILAWKKK